jgi:hypothetical protein
MHKFQENISILIYFPCFKIEGLSTGLETKLKINGGFVISY